MTYTILIHESPAALAMRSDPDPAQREALFAPVFRYIKALRDAGIHVAGAGLQPPETATRLSMRDGKRHVQDGPYADTKEQLGGFFVINVPDLDTALDWAARTPHAAGRICEVRPNLVPPTN